MHPQVYHWNGPNIRIITPPIKRVGVPDHEEPQEKKKRKKNPDQARLSAGGTVKRQDISPPGGVDATSTEDGKTGTP